MFAVLTHCASLGELIPLVVVLRHGFRCLAGGTVEVTHLRCRGGEIHCLDRGLRVLPAGLEQVEADDLLLDRIVDRGGGGEDLAERCARDRVS